jgi:hypothetical protein
VVAAGAVALVAVAAIVVVLLVRDGDDTAPQTFPTKPVASSVDGLRAFATAIGHPVYWVGSLPSYTYELRLTRQGRVFVRYLPKGVDVGDRRASFLTVATYPVAGAVAALRRAAAAGGVGMETEDGGFAYYARNKPTSVYYASPRASGYQVEVFDPSPRRARSFVLSGRIRPIG